MDRIINDALYLGYSAFTSAGAGLATCEIINGNYLSGIVCGALTTIPLYWTNEALKRVRYFRENKKRSEELREKFYEFEQEIQEIKAKYPEAFR